MALNFKDRWVGNILSVTLNLQYHISVAVLTREGDRNSDDGTANRTSMMRRALRICDFRDVTPRIDDFTRHLDSFQRCRPTASLPQARRPSSQNLFASAYPFIPRNNCEDYLYGARKRSHINVN